MKKCLVMLGVAALAVLLTTSALAGNRGVTFTPIGFSENPGPNPASRVQSMNPQGTVFIVSPDATMLFSGDSAWNEDFVEKSQGVDLFLCECCTMEPIVPMHTSYAELLAHRDRLGCKRLLLTHLGADVRNARDFRFERVEDGMVFDVGGTERVAAARK